MGLTITKKEKTMKYAQEVLDVMADCAKVAGLEQISKDIKRGYKVEASVRMGVRMMPAQSAALFAAMGHKAGMVNIVTLRAAEARRDGEAK
jgi:hypothetical protein